MSAARVSFSHPVNLFRSTFPKTAFFDLVGMEIATIEIATIEISTIEIATIESDNRVRQ